MRCSLTLLAMAAMTGGFLACDAAPGQARQGSASASAASNASPTDSLPMNTPDSPPPPTASPYRLLGILDPDRDNMVAFALKIPTGWRAQQSFKRQWVGATPQNQVYISLRSPDGSAQIEYLPLAAYVYSDGPMSQNLRASKQQMGMSPQLADNELPPPSSVAAYVREQMLPYLAQNGLALDEVGNEQEAAPKREKDGRTLTRGSVDGTLPNGRRARVECRVLVSSQQINGDTYYSWTVVPSVTQAPTADALAATYAHTRVAQEAIVPNPAWQKLEQDVQNRGAQMNSEASRRQHEATMGQIDANSAAMTRAHDARMGDIARQGAANTARHNDRMAAMDDNKAAFDSRMHSQDQQHQYAVDGIRGEARYADPTTGERVKVADDYRHVYSNGQGGYLGTNTPIEAGQVNWQELQKLSQKEY